MNPMVEFFTSRFGGLIGWGLSAFLALSMGATIFMLKLDNGHLKDAIHNPRTGWSARLDRANESLAVARVNALTLTNALNVQNAAVLKSQAESRLRETALATAAEAAHRDAKEAKDKVARLNAIAGSTCADAENMIMEALK